MKNSPQDRTISVEELFIAAFNRSEIYYQRQSLLGWRPVAADIQSYIPEGNGQSPSKESLSFSNSPDISVRETPDAILIEVTLPDIDEDSLFLEISGDLLIIRAEQLGSDRSASAQNGDGEKQMVHRYVKLPIAAQPGNVQARLDNNVLRVIINKPWSGIEKDMTPN